MTAGVLPLQADEIESSIVARWRKVVAHVPHATAVTSSDGRHHTYAELDDASNRVAYALLDVLGDVNCPVLLCLDHSYPLLVSILGTIKAGKAYAAIDTRQPLGQLQLLHRTTAAPAIITSQNHLSLARALADSLGKETVRAGGPLAVLSLDQMPDRRSECPDIPIGPDTIAGLFFTSGTVKQPRGVARSHRIVLHRSWFGVGGPPFTPGDTISGLRQCGLGGGMADVFNAFLYGASYCLYDLHGKNGLHGLSEWLQRQQISYFHPPIVLFRQWLDALTPAHFFPHLRHVLPSGRKTRADVERLWPHVPEECTVLTSYSATETTQITQAAITRASPLAEGVLHVGAPLPGKSIAILGPDDQPVPSGDAGQIVVRSRYIASGYWRQPEMTRQRFVRSDDGSGETTFLTGDYGRLRTDGYLELVGRRDSQVKVSGYRVVLHEIEDALRAVTGVRDAVVTADEEQGRLHAYLIPTSQPPTPAAEIRGALALRFPSYALPTHISFLPSFPLLPSGKVDRKRLPPPARSRPVHLPPRTAPQSSVEEALVALWAELLQMDDVGTQDNFFDLGGHSLLAMRMFAALHQQFGRSVPMLAFAATPTIAGLAAHLRIEPHGGTVDEHADPPDVLNRDRFTLRVATQRRVRQGRGKRRTERDAPPAAPSALRARLAAWLCGQAWFYRRHFDNEVELIRTFYGALSGPRPPLHELVRHSLLAHWWARHMEGQLRSVTSRAQSDRLFAVRGLSNLHEALNRGRGVILARSHTLGRREALHAMARHGFNDILSIGLGSASRQLRKKWDETYVMAVRSHLLFQSQRALSEGRIVSILPDGFHGNHEGIRFDFHGRQRTFRTGFAELALDTGATIVVVSASIDLTGRVLVDVAPPLTLPPAASRAEQLTSVLTQFVELLRTHWALYPAAVPWWHMRKHLALTPCDSSG